MPARTYEIRLSGLVPTEHLRAQVGDLDVAEQEVRTVLSARFADQAELHGFLNRLQSLGLEVVEIRRLLTGSPGGRAGDSAGGGSNDTATTGESR